MTPTPRGARVGAPARSYIGYDSGFSVLAPEHYHLYEIEPLR